LDGSPLLTLGQRGQSAVRQRPKSIDRRRVSDHRLGGTFMARRLILSMPPLPTHRSNLRAAELFLAGTPIRAARGTLWLMAFWIVFAFLLGLGVGALAIWWLLGGPPLPSPSTAPARPGLEPADEVPDSMSLTAQRLLTDLERKYEGTVATGDEEAADKPKRPRAKRAPRVARKDPAGPA
jgi:hypothetical protein